ncbi:beta-N-acetylhexosaminidase [Paenibacillus sp. PDC88]|uniref:beta-N-acetylhexosaminidase n=1 Tax=Paenibacillus sp. PDC88 TaxID=1884375 RepID=UPI000B87DB32|nr:beta-N-acetylhexosaminidase [Paenibacillus sp. PDC88]
MRKESFGYRKLAYYILIMLAIVLLTSCNAADTGTSLPDPPKEQEQEQPGGESGSDHGPDEEGADSDSESPPDAGSESESDAEDGQTSITPEHDDLLPAQEAAMEQLANLSIEDKIGQMIISGFPGTELDMEAEELIRNGQLGGVILFGPNIRDQKQLQALINEVKKSNGEGQQPMFISVDEEGGRVSRLPEGKTEFPSNQQIGKYKNAEISAQIGNVIGEELGAFGFNLNFAPVLDIFSNPENTVIGDRSFGDSAETVSELGIATMKGMQEAGVIPAVKHFPGHGDTKVDSHVGLPVVQKTKEELAELELVPFQAAIEAGADMMMAAHIQYPKIDASLRPASLSKVMLSTLLREEMGYDGVVITDDLEMGAIQQNYGSGEAALMAIQAGADIVLFGHTPAKAEKAYNTLLQAVRKGELSAADIDRKVLRILTLKYKYELTNEPVEESALQVVGSSEHQQIADQLKK